MKRFLRNLSLALAAGAVGGLVSGLVLWAGVHFGLLRRLHVQLSAGLSLAWFYPRLVWGGLWGLLLLVPILERRPVVRGLVLSLAPSAYQLLVEYPRVPGPGVLGTGLGWLAPVVVVLLNALWGVVAVAWFRGAA